MSSFCTAKGYSHLFSKKIQHICISLDVNFNVPLTNDAVSFEQLGPVYAFMSSSQLLGINSAKFKVLLLGINSAKFKVLQSSWDTELHVV